MVLMKHELSTLSENNAAKTVFFETDCKRHVVSFLLVGRCLHSYYEVPNSNFVPIAVPLILILFNMRLRGTACHELLFSNVILPPLTRDEFIYEFNNDFSNIKIIEV